MTAVHDPARLHPGELLAALGELGCGRTAQVYAALGYPVVPMHTAQPGGDCTCPDPDCRETGKHPRVRGWQRLAAIDAAVVGEWWRRWSDANLGLVTGRRFDVLDLDGDQGGEALQAVLSITPTEHPGPVARTGGGGWHLLYAPTGLGNRVKFLPGMDWRGLGGLIVATAQPGRRNATLNRAAFNLGQLVAAGLLEADQVRAVLLTAALEAGNPEAKARATITSGLRGGAAKPRRRRAGAA
jgi:Bifunctional DNA primase/polymerase, N-terminal